MTDSDTGALLKSKQARRSRILAARDGLPLPTRAALSEQIAEHLREVEALASAQCVLAYCSFGSEFDTSAWLRALQEQGKQLALPRVDREARRLVLYLVSDFSLDVAPGVWGIREPLTEHCPLAPNTAIDAILAPGVAFTAAGARLGYGGGYYDRLLAAWPTPRPAVVAAAFSVQVVDRLPMGPDDVWVDLVVTENGPLGRA